MDYAIALGKLKRFARRGDGGRPEVREDSIELYSNLSQLYSGPGRELETKQYQATAVEMPAGTIYLAAMGDSQLLRSSSGRKRCVAVLVRRGNNKGEWENVYSATNAVEQSAGGRIGIRLGRLGIWMAIEINSQATKRRLHFSACWDKPLGYGYWDSLEGNGGFQGEANDKWGRLSLKEEEHPEVLSIAQEIVCGRKTDITHVLVDRICDSLMDNYGWLADASASVGGDTFEDGSPVEPVEALAALRANSEYITKSGVRITADSVGFSPFKLYFAEGVEGRFGSLWELWTAMTGYKFKQPE